MNEETLKRLWLKNEETEIDLAVGDLLASRHGRRFLWWLLEIGKINMQPFTSNALTTAFGCGELNVGNRILDRVTSVSPDGYVTMMKESADERRSRDEQLASAGADTDSEPDSGASA